MKTSITFYFLILLLAASPKLFPQLDSVYYQGPSQGSVISGAIQSTDNFTDNISIVDSEQKVSPLTEVMIYRTIIFLDGMHLNYLSTDILKILQY